MASKFDLSGFVHPDAAGFTSSFDSVVHYYHRNNQGSFQGTNNIPKNKEVITAC